MSEILEGSLKASNIFHKIENPYTGQSLEIVNTWQLPKTLEYRDPDFTARFPLSVVNRSTGSNKKIAEINLNEIEYENIVGTYGSWCRIFLFMVDVVGVWFQHNPKILCNNQPALLKGGWSNGSWDETLIAEIGYRGNLSLCTYLSGEYSLTPIYEDAHKWDLIYPMSLERKFAWKLKRNDNGLMVFEAGLNAIEELISNVPYFVRRDKNAYLFHQSINQGYNRHQGGSYLLTHLGYCNSDCAFTFYGSTYNGIGSVKEPIFFENDKKINELFCTTFRHDDRYNELILRRGGKIEPQQKESKPELLNIELTPELHHELILTFIDINAARWEKKSNWPPLFKPSIKHSRKNTIKNIIRDIFQKYPVTFASNLTKINYRKHYFNLDVSLSSEKWMLKKWKKRRLLTLLTKMRSPFVKIR